MPPPPILLHRDLLVDGDFLPVDLLAPLFSVALAWLPEESEVECITWSQAGGYRTVLHALGGNSLAWAYRPLKPDAALYERLLAKARNEARFYAAGPDGIRRTKTVESQGAVARKPRQTDFAPSAEEAAAENAFFAANALARSGPWPQVLVLDSVEVAILDAWVATRDIFPKLESDGFDRRELLIRDATSKLPLLGAYSGRAVVWIPDLRRWCAGIGYEISPAELPSRWLEGLLWLKRFVIDQKTSDDARAPQQRRSTSPRSIDPSKGC